jgi:DNA-binding Lrp family transcriptional regulator
MILSELDYQLVAEIQQGLPLVSHPYEEIGVRIGMSESEVITRIQSLLDDGIIKRLGVIVRHHELGYRNNAMVVFDIPDTEVDAVGQRVAATDYVTLCYRRPRHLPDWPYNLFCMIHGKHRLSVLYKIAQLITRCELSNKPYQVLFSGQRFKQCGARYVMASKQINSNNIIQYRERFH